MRTHLMSFPVFFSCTFSSVTSFFRLQISNSIAAVFIRCMSPAHLFWFRIRKWAQSFVLCLYAIVYVFLRLYTCNFSSSLTGGGAGNMLYPLFWFWIRKWTQSFVFRLYMIVYSFFRLHTSYFSTSPGGGGGRMLHFFYFGFENELNLLYFVCTWLYTGSSTETVAFQVYKILKIDREFLQFFWLGSKI